VKSQQDSILGIEKFSDCNPLPDMAHAVYTDIKLKVELLLQGITKLTPCLLVADDVSAA